MRVVIGAPTLDVPPSPALVYLPPAYDSPANAGRRYPVVYLLHGYPGSPLDWFRAVPTQQIMDTMLADHLIQPMIVVAPNANGGWLTDSEMLNKAGGPQTETYLTRTVVGYVDAHFRTVAARAGRSSTPALVAGGLRGGEVVRGAGETDLAVPDGPDAVPSARRPRISPSTRRPGPRSGRSGGVSLMAFPPGGGPWPGGAVPAAGRAGAGWRTSGRRAAPGRRSARCGWPPGPG